MQKALVISSIGSEKKKYKILLYRLTYYQLPGNMIAKGE